MDNLDSIKASIHSIPNEFKDLPFQGERKWTHAVKMSLGNLGTNLHYRVCAGGDNGFDSEWLYDLLWYTENELGQLEQIPLILESEWNRSYFEIKKDFEKLLLGKARYKIMIFQAVGNKKEEYFSKLKSAIETYNAAPSGETYILACFDQDEWIFDVREIHY
jgi:hypothetical protein